MELTDTEINILLKRSDIVEYASKNYIFSNFDAFDIYNLKATYLLGAPNNQYTREYIRSNFYHPINNTFLTGSLNTEIEGCIYEVSEDVFLKSRDKNELMIPTYNENGPYEILSYREKNLIDSAVKNIRRICTEYKYQILYYPSDINFNFKSSNPNTSNIVNLFILTSLRFYFQ